MITRRLCSLCAFLLVAACSSRHVSSTSSGETSSGATAPAIASAVFVTDAGAADAGALDAGARSCVHPAYQPNTCLNAEGELEDEAIVGWFSDRGVKVKEGFPGYAAHCRELPFGPEADPVLVCTTDDFVPGPQFGNGPLGYHRDLRVLGVRNRKAFELLRLPLALTEALHWDDGTLFAARYEVDAAAGTVDLVIDADECELGRKGVAAYHQDWVDTLAESMKGAGQAQRDQVAARKAQGRMDDARISKTCSAAGHYAPIRGGRLERAR